MADVTVRHGAPVKIDYTPTGGNVAVGQVVLLGNTTGLCCGVAERPITNNTLGALGGGGGVYDAINLNNSANYATVYWDNSAKKVTSVTTNNALFGFICASGGGGANSTCRVLHKPYVV